MGVFEAILVFGCTWWLIFLPILSWGTRSQHEANDVIPGTERAAPVKANLKTKAIIATAVTTVITLVIWLTIRQGWLAFIIPKY
jgi:predicted secreted protein